MTKSSLESLVATTRAVATRRSLLSVLAGLGLSAPEVRAADHDHGEETKLVSAFCAAWATRGLEEALTFLTPDCVYRMTEKARPVVGLDAIRSALEPIVSRSQAVEFKVLASAALGPIVINRRVDHFATKPRPFIWEGTGVFFVRDNRIAEWSDYTTRMSR